MSFTFKEEKHGDVNIIFIEGKILENQEDNPLLVEIGSDLSAQKWLLDLSKMTTMNSSGINLFIKCFTRVRNHGGEMVFCSIPDSIKKLLIITKLDTIFTICADIESGLKQLNTTQV